MNEAEWLTRKSRIDTKLRSLNPQWQIVPWKEGLDTTRLTCHAVTEFPTANGPADYALFVNGVLLAIIEAKKVTVNPQNVLEQAKRYAAGATNGPGNWNSLRVPFWAAADKMRGHMDAWDYKHVVLGLIFLKYISDAYAEKLVAFEKTVSPLFARVLANIEESRALVALLPKLLSGKSRVPRAA